MEKNPFIAIDENDQVQPNPNYIFSVGCYHHVSVLHPFRARMNLSQNQSMDSLNSKE
jgi:hypothetical protein